MKLERIPRVSSCPLGRAQAAGSSPGTRPGCPPPGEGRWVLAVLPAWGGSGGGDCAVLLLNTNAAGGREAGFC